MGCAPAIHQCVDCGASGAGVQLADDQGNIADDLYCWDCAMGRSTPIPEKHPVRYMLALLDPAWVRSRKGAVWLAQRLSRSEGNEE